MTIPSFLTDLLARRREQRDAAEADYRDLVGRIASGASPADKQIDQVLTATGKTVTDLGCDVGAELERRERIGRVARRAELLAQIGEIHGQMGDRQAGFVAAWSALVTEHQAKMGELTAQEQLLQRELSGCDSAARQLLHGNPRLESIAKQLGQLTIAERALRAAAGGLHRTLPHDSIAGQRIREIERERTELLAERERIELELTTLSN